MVPYSYLMDRGSDRGRVRPSAGWACFIGAVSALLTAAPLSLAADGAPTVVVIGGKKQGYAAGEHDYPDGALKLARLLKASPQFTAAGAVVKTYPVGIPKNLSELDHARVLVLYFGMDYAASGNAHPWETTEARRQIDKLMARGAGLVALHQSFTVPAESSQVPFSEWLGAVRVGMADRTTEIAPLEVTGIGHPISNGLGAFEYLDEFYPSLAFSKAMKVTPILSARIHVQHRNGVGVFDDPAKSRVVAWATERADGGRAFGFSGAHYLAALDQPQVRTMLLNAILWAAKLDVPPSGATSATPARQRSGELSELTRLVLPVAQSSSEDQPWGKLEWFASRALGNSTKITVGRATIGVGKANPVHWHPNCDEVLHVRQGRIMHRVGDREYEMHAGDTVTIPEGVLHNARNIGTEEAILDISFSSADRVAIGE